jgi:hypothetical protein
MTLDAAFPAALWTMSDKTGIRPEWILPVMQLESGLNPAIGNAGGYPYYGLNQISGRWLQARGIAPADYLTWPASQQVLRVVSEYMREQQAAFGPLRSATRVYQANLYPASLKTATTMDGVVIASKGPCSPGRTSDPYCANVALDHDKSGAIEVRDLAWFMGKEAATKGVQAQIAAAYALRPGEKMSDPVLGYDFGGAAPTPVLPIASGSGGLVLFAAFVALAWAASGAPMTLRSVRRAIA